MSIRQLIRTARPARAAVVAALLGGALACGSGDGRSCAADGALSAEEMDVLEPVIRQAVGSQAVYVRIEGTAPPCSLLSRFSRDDRVRSGTRAHQVPRDRLLYFDRPQVGDGRATVTYLDSCGNVCGTCEECRLSYEATVGWVIDGCDTTCVS